MYVFPMLPAAKNREQYKINIKQYHSKYKAPLRTQQGRQQIDFASSHKWFAKIVTKKSIELFPSPQEFCFIHNACEKDD